MPAIDWATLINGAPQIATAVAFGYFILRLLERQDRQNDKRDAEWRGYLDLGRTVYVESITSMTAEIKSLAGAVVAVHNALAQHDNWSKTEAIRRDAAQLVTAAAVAAEAVRVASDVAARVTERALKGGGG